MKRKTRKHIITIIGSITLVLALILTLTITLQEANPSVTGNKILAMGLSTTDIFANPLQQMPPDEDLINGLWYEDINNPIYIDEYRVSFMKIYSLGGGFRVMELSTYPRAYKDTSPHIYEVDTPFIVTTSDLNYTYVWWPDSSRPYREGVEDGTEVYLDTRDDIYLLGETAYHWTGDPLPGEFPLWVESEALPTPKWVDSKTSIFPLVFSAVKGELTSVDFYEGTYREDTDTEWTAIPQDMMDTLYTMFVASDVEIKVNKITKNKDRTIVRIFYLKTIA